MSWSIQANGTKDKVTAALKEARESTETMTDRDRGQVIRAVEYIEEEMVNNVSPAYDISATGHAERTYTGFSVSFRTRKE